MPRSSVASELYKDKIEIVLDNRQIFYLFFGGSVIMGLVFVLGVMVGRRVEVRGRLEHTHSQATVDPLAALDRLAGGAGLSFQGQLRNSSPPTGKASNLVAPRHDDALKTDQSDDHKPEANKAGDKKIEDKNAEAKQADSQKSDDAPSEAKKADDKKPDDKKAEAKKADDKKNDDKKKESKSKFALQLSSFQARSEAEAYLSQVKANGFGAFITEAKVDGKTYYRVRMGNYRSLDAANSAKAEVDKAMKKSATVMKL